MQLFTPGLVSVSFRSFSPAEIVMLAVQAQVQALEWGGDIHVPPGDVPHARAVGSLTHDNGLKVVAYGSYYRVGVPDQSGTWERCIETARALGAPTIRVWAGNEGSPHADSGTWSRVADDMRRIALLAAEAGIAVATEFHGGTLCDTADTTLQLLARASSPNLKTLWQPLGDALPEERAAQVQTLLPHLAHIHVFHWPHGQRVGLAEGKNEWQAVLAALTEAGRPTALLLEFVRDDDPQQFLTDAAELRRWIETQGWIKTQE